MSPPAHERPELVLDARNRVALVNGAWLRIMCARADDVDAAAFLIDRPFQDFISGTQVRQVWEILFERVRTAGAPIFIPMRADTAILQRVWDLELHPLPERGLRIVAHFAWSQERPAIRLLDPAAARSDESLPHCAWCNRSQVRLGTWEEVEDAQVTLRLDTSRPLPLLLAAVCNGCKQSLLKTFPARVA